MSIVNEEPKSTRILKQLAFTTSDEQERRDWKNEMIDLEYHVNPDNRTAFIYGDWKITMLLFKNTEDMFAELGELQEDVNSLDVHFQD